MQLVNGRGARTLVEARTETPTALVMEKVSWIEDRLGCGGYLEEIHAS
jgi:hypothetical protein